VPTRRGLVVLARSDGWRWQGQGSRRRHQEPVTAAANLRHRPQPPPTRPPDAPPTWPCHRPGCYTGFAGRQAVPPIRPPPAADSAAVAPLSLPWRRLVASAACRRRCLPACAACLPALPACAACRRCLLSPPFRRPCGDAAGTQPPLLAPQKVRTTRPPQGASKPAQSGGVNHVPWSVPRGYHTSATDVIVSVAVQVVAALSSEPRPGNREGGTVVMSGGVSHSW
jgi:hypothetical protein